MRLLKWACFTLFFIIMPNAFANTEVNSLNQLLQNFHSMQANFTQTISDANGNSSNQQTGKVVIMKPGKFRWQVISPNEQLYISDGKTLWNIEPDLDQVTRSALTQNLSTTPLLLLSGNISDINSVFKVTELSANQYRLIPTDNDSLIKEVALTFNQGMISQISVTNTMGQVATVIFTDIKFNVKVPANTFNYTPDKSMQVLTQ